MRPLTEELLSFIMLFKAHQKLAIRETIWDEDMEQHRGSSQVDYYQALKEWFFGPILTSDTDILGVQRNQHTYEYLWELQVPDAWLYEEVTNLDQFQVPI